jgi:PAS domain S-box-containing protein
LPEQTERLRSLGAALSPIAEGVLVVDAEARAVFASAGLQELARQHFAPGQDIRRPTDAARVRHRDGRPMPWPETPLARALGGDVVVECVLSFELPGDDERLVSVTASPVKDDAGALIGAYVLLRDVTGRLRAEEALRRSEERLRITEQTLRRTTMELEAIFSALPDLYFRVDAQGTYLDCRAGRTADLYVPAEELLGKRIRDVMPPEVAGMLEEATAYVLSTQSVATLEYSLTWGENTQCFEVRILPLLEDQVVAVVRNITERKRMEVDNARLYEAEREARAQAERKAAELRALLGSMAESVTVIDGEGNIVLQNEASRTYGGNAYKHVTESHRYLRLLHPNGDPVPVEEYPTRRLLRGDSFTDVEYIIELNDGRRRNIVASASAVREDSGALTLGVLVARDITELRQLELAREDVMRAISHDLRQPVTIVLSAGQMLRRRLARANLESEVTDADRIIMGAKRMASMIDDLVDSARLESGKLALRMEKCNLVRLLHDIAQRAWTPQDQARLRIEPPPSALPLVDLDPERFERILVNLVGNALKYSPPEESVTIGVEARAAEVVIAVRDRGVGVPREELPHLFERYFRARTGKRMEGLGLGLFIARLLVEAHGGRIWVDSEVGRGSTFAFALPFGKGAEGARLT